MRGNREIVLATVAQDGRSLPLASFALRQHRALRWISATNLALHCAKLRLTLTMCASLPAPLSHAGCTLSALPGVLVEIIGMYISAKLAISVAVRDCGYWCDSGSHTSSWRGRDDSRHKKCKWF